MNEAELQLRRETFVQAQGKFIKLMSDKTLSMKERLEYAHKVNKIAKAIVRIDAKLSK